MHKTQEQVREFHRVVLGGPTSPAEPMIRHGELRARLILEEAIETAVALVGGRAARIIVAEEWKKLADEGDTAPNLIEAIDGCIDLEYVTLGTLEDIGVDGEPFFDEVHAANMRKRDPERKQLASLSPVGKVLKPEGWKPPDIAGVLAKMVRR